MSSSSPPAPSLTKNSGPSAPAPSFLAELKDAVKAQSSNQVDKSSKPFSKEAAQSNRHPDMWGAVRILGRNKEFLKQVSLFQPKSGMDDEQILETFEDKYRKKNPDGFIFFSFETFMSENPPPNRVNPSLYHLKPVSQKPVELDKKTNTSDYIRELQHFEKDAAIHYHYVNNLYVWPLRVLNWKHKGSCQISVKLLDTDDVNADGLTCVYGGCLNPKFVQSGTSVINPETKSFFDEFKLRLPPKIDVNHHLIFTIYNVEIKKGKHEVVGYALFPLFKNNKMVLFEQIEEIPIYSELKSGYMASSQDKSDSKDRKESHKFSLCINTKLISSVLFQDKFIHGFFYQTPNSRNYATHLLNYDKDVKRIMELQYAQPSEILKYFLGISKELFNIICIPDSNSEATSKQALVQLIYVIKTVNIETKAKQSKVLREYAQYMVENHAFMQEKDKGLPIFEALTHHYLALLSEKHNCLDLFHLHWFFLTIITRSMALYLNTNNRVQLPRQQRFSSKFISELTELVIHLLDDKTLLAHMAIFFRELLCMIDRGVVLKLFDLYLSSMEPSLQLAFLCALASHEYFVQLNLPIPLKFPEVVDWKEFMNSSYKLHHLSGKLIQNVTSYLTLNQQDPFTVQMRSRAIQSFRAILSEVEADKRYNDRARQSRIATTYFPFLLILIDNPSIITALPLPEKSDWCLCFIYLLRNINANVFTSWMEIETKKRQMAFFVLLRECLCTFENGVKQVIHQVAVTILDVISNFILVHSKDLNEETSDSFSIFKYIIFIFKALFNIPQLEIQELVIGPIQQLVESCSNVLFPDITSVEKETNDYLEILMNEIMKLSISESRSIRNGTCTLLYKLLKANYKSLSSISRVRVCASIAISKIIGSQASNSTLNDSLNTIRLLAGLEDRDQASDEFSSQVRKMVENMETLLEQNQLINQNKDDPDTLAALYLKLADGFSHSPKLRLTWLNNLTELHIKRGNKCEAGICKVSMAVLLVHYLKRVGQLKRLPTYFDELFEATVPYIKSLNLQSEVGILIGDNWTVLQLIETVEEAVKLFEDATFFELCFELYALLEQLYKSERKYQKLITNLDQHKALINKITDPEKSPDRLLPVYFRLGFYGSGWDADLKNRQFIYKKETISLPAMIKLVEDQFTKKYGENVVVLSGNKNVDELNLEDNKLYIQIAGVHPYISPEESSYRVTPFDQNFNIDKFLFETAFADEGKKSITDDLTTQKKKKTIFVTKYPFPYLETRIEVIHTEEIILSPIQNAIELITTQTAKVQSQLEAVPPRVNPLQQTLQGSVVPMVNPGPIRVCETFFSPQSIKQGLFNDKDVRKLMDVMEVFVKKCGFAVKLNQYVMEEKHAKFTEMIEKSYHQLEATVKAAIEDAKKALDESKGERERENVQ
eukprot:TRINITY_DN1035_c0_g1_i3.p1 TRINITY_DN1035_c0_g1~~TRINITY_DN1035_c0_g1_i3.p1  ORF type:complete len:1398 (-),score=386.54 TRINITY_DN1035_c0_g1_i3:198-4391(-)